MFTQPDESELHSRSIEKIPVLLVDDNPAFLEIGKMFLETNGSELISSVITASNGQDAIALAQIHCPHLIILDIAMPNMNGLEIASHLKHILPEAHIIMLTLLKTFGYREAALAAGADDLIDKSNIDTDLLPTIQRIMRPMKK